MFPASFEYHRAASVKDALSILQQFGEDAKLLSGGHSLLPMMKLRLAQPAHLVDIGGIRDLRQIKQEGGKIVIGGLVTHHQVESSDLIRGQLGLLAECATLIGDVQVRNRGTIGGSLAHADPAADYPAAVLALEAEIRIEGSAGTRTVKAGDFFVDLMTTAIKPGEILTQVAFAPLGAGAGYAYLKHRQPASGFAIVGVAALVALDKSGNLERVRVGITGLGAKAFRAQGVEAAQVGKAPDGIAAAAAHAPDGIDALADIHASADFRAELARVYTRRALERAVARAKR
ncbi:MAG TPA: xanthine dehydrogenase family protein subunit M [Candidatus Binataceae bacterium]